MPNKQHGETAVIAARVPSELKRRIEATAHLAGMTSNDVIVIALGAYLNSLPKEQKAKIELAMKETGTLKLPSTLNPPTSKPRN